MKQPQLIVATMIGRDESHVAYAQERLDPVELTQIDLRVPPFGQPLTFEDGPSEDRVLYGDTVLAPSWIWWRALPAALASSGLDSEQVVDWTIPVHDTGLGPDQVVQWALPFAIQNMGHNANALAASLPETLHVSHPDAMRRAMLKRPQIRLARAVGFRTPRSLQTGHPGLARAFVDREIALTGVCIKKCIESSAPIHPERGPLAMPTLLLTADYLDRLDWDSLPLAPSIFEQRIIGDDVTIAVVGDRVFPAKVVSSVDELKNGFRDYRMGWVVEGGNVQVEPIRISAEDEARCVEFVRRSGVRFARLDCIRDVYGNLWFLESNPSGSWAFLQDAGLKVGHAIADLMLAA